MKTRMEKYYTKETNGEVVLSRSKKNEQLYKEVNTTELEDFNLNSNVSILGENGANININEIQEILDKKYHEEPRKPVMKAEPLPLETLDLSETREYDINAIIDKAKETKEVDYEVDRLKKLRNTQYDILNNLDLNPKKEDENEVTVEQVKLMDLINTITSKELAQEVNKQEDESETGELDPLDLFTDLKGNNENTTTLGAIKEELLEEAKKNNEDKVKTKEYNLSQDKNLKNDNKENTFATNSMQFVQSDFDDFNDLKDDMKAAKIIIKVLIVLVIIAFLAGCFILLNNILDLGLL